MADANEIKVGLISCSGEEISEGTLSRAAVRIVLEKLRPQNTVTICLPLFLAGDGGERAFTQRFPTITIDGCSKLCAKKGTEKYSGKVDDAIVIEEILKSLGEKTPESRRDFNHKDWALAEKVAKEIAKRVDKVLESAGALKKFDEQDGAPQMPVCSCMSGGAKPDVLNIAGNDVEITALGMIIKFIASKSGLSEEERAGEMLKQVKIYNGAIPGISEDELKVYLSEEYRKRVS